MNNSNTYYKKQRRIARTTTKSSSPKRRAEPPPPKKKKKKYENNKSRLQEQALNKCRELSNEEKDIKLCLRKIKKNYKSITKSLLFVYRIKNEC